MAWTKHDAGSGQDGVPVEPFWESFRLDPRQPGHAPMRASDADREIVRATLGDAFADGRLTREEYDDRLNTLYGSRTLGEVSSLVTDLVPLDGPPMARAPRLGADMRTRAARKWRKEVEESLAAFLVPSIICTVIWIAVPSPTVGAGRPNRGMPAARVMLHTCWRVACGTGSACTTGRAGRERPSWTGCVLPLRSGGGYT